jgi:polysaccharide deacetylase family protein (PEP-CTERM system associated)
MSVPVPITTVVNAMSIDVEDYFHVSVFDGLVPRSKWESMESRVHANTMRLLEIFAEFGVRSTFFVLAWVGERHQDLVATIARQGHEIASHGYAHRLIYDQTPEGFRDDVRRAKAILEDACGRKVVGYRAPSYSVTARSLWALDVLVEEGYEYDSSIFPIRHDRYGIPVSAREPYVIERNGLSLIEIPGSTTRLGPLNVPVAGGGYFRLLPYWWTKWGISRVNTLEQRPAIFYAGRLSRFRHYRNLDQTEARLRQLLTDFRFDAVDAVVAQARSMPLEHGHLTMPLPYSW